MNKNKSHQYLNVSDLIGNIAKDLFNLGVVWVNRWKHSAIFQEVDHSTANQCLLFSRSKQRTNGCTRVFERTSATDFLIKVKRKKACL